MSKRPISPNENLENKKAKILPNIDEYLPNGLTLLHAAVLSGELNQVKGALEAGAI